MSRFVIVFFHLQVCWGETLPMMLGNFDKQTFASFFLFAILFWRNVGKFFVEKTIERNEIFGYILPIYLR